MRNPIKCTLALFILGLGLIALTARATTVQFQTVMGDFEVNLFDNTTPETVANFLEYVEAGDYTDTFFHRSVPGFVVQGGGFFYDYSEKKAFNIAANDPVNNEPELSNQRGTIAMAKLGSNPNSATNQWFFNLADNSANLDNQNGGFTVFGQVTGNGMAIIDAIAALRRENFGNAFTHLPLRNYSDEDLENQVPLTHEHLVMIQTIVVLDPSPDTANGLNPKPTTRKDNSGGGNGGGGDSSGGGGSFGFWLLLMLAGGQVVRRISYLKLVSR